MRVDGQHLDIAEFDQPRWRRAPIDLFFRSLAAQRSDDFAIVLSGAGSDGALGIKALKEAAAVHGDRHAGFDERAGEGWPGVGFRKDMTNTGSPAAVVSQSGS